MFSFIAIYAGVRLSEAPGHVLVRVDGKPLPHVVVHSPTGFEWGYGGSGPADLALSILAHHFGEDASFVRAGERFNDESGEWILSKAWVYHDPFKWAFCARWQDEWTITSEEIDRWLAGREAVL